jgi:hypothetical protein
MNVGVAKHMHKFRMLQIEYVLNQALLMMIVDYGQDTYDLLPL